MIFELINILWGNKIRNRAREELKRKWACPCGKTENECNEAIEAFKIQEGIKEEEQKKKYRRTL
jgi:hypothetical protein